MRPQWIIGALLLLYAVLAWTSVSGKSATYDEPLHLAAAMAQSHGDLRVDPEDPAGFKAWLGLALPDRPLPTDNDFWREMSARPEAQWAWSVLTVFGNGDHEAIVARGRFMMLLAAIGLGVVIAAWSWQIAGPKAAILATAIFALDPNFLGHGPIAKNDVIFTLGYVGTAYAVWHVGRRVCWKTVTCLALAAGVTVTLKFSGVMLAGLVPVMLLLRLPLPGGERAGVRGEPSPGDWRDSQTGASPLTPALSPLGRGGMVLGVITLVGLSCAAFVWLAYGFRYAPSGDSGFQFDLADRTTTAPILRKVDELHLLPQAYTYGLAYTIDSTTTRDAYLLGRKSSTGWWWYFPVAMAVKTPLATMMLLLVAIGALFRLRLRKHSWTLICLLIPAVLYAVLAFRSNLNIGLRHMLPVYPLAFIAIGVVLSRHIKLASGLIVLLAIESAIAFPNYIAHFNLAAGGSKGGVRILSDSNLDWGQDLPKLAEWQAKHPDTRLYLSYFGTADPGSYGIRYTNIGAGYGFLPTTMPKPGESGVIAVSATHLQGMYVPPNLLWFYKALRKQDPIAVLGGTIYLYEWP